MASHELPMTAEPRSSARPPEVLAPAGDRACLEAAVRAGADAVYFGLQAFNARARATNFGDETLAEVMGFLHRHGVRGYVTLNTLLFDDELDAASDAIRRCDAAGVDALIVQDLGCARLARAVAPRLPLHASTQMTCTDAEAVELARELGARRVILARELSLADIADIRGKSDVEVEVFVHGALCIAYSGQCLTSEAIGGRSANRGACAQSCRLPYELFVDGEKRPLGDRAYLLSPQDLEASALVPQLCALGVASLKIEGRLKGPEYVAATTALYRRAVDAVFGLQSVPGDAERRRALVTYSRGSGPGFLAGVDHQRLVDGRGSDHRGVEIGLVIGLGPRRGELVVKLAAPLARGHGVLVEGGLASQGEVGGRVWSVAVVGEDVPEARAGSTATVWLGPERTVIGSVAGRRLFLSDDPAEDRSLRALAERGRRRLDLRIHGRLGEPAVLVGRAGAAMASVVVEGVVDVARGRGLGEDDLREKLGRLGDTVFELGSLAVDLPERAHLGPSALNRARRALVAALEAGVAPDRPEPSRATEALPLDEALPASPTDLPGGLFVLCRSLPQAQAALAAGADGVYLDFLELTGTGRAFAALRASNAPWIGVAPPRIRKPGEEKIDRFLASLEPDGILVRGLGALRSSPPGPWLRIGDFSLNVVNRLSATEVLRRGLAGFTPAFDLDSEQLVRLLAGGLGPRAEVVLHHPMALFHMEHCVIAALLSEGSDHLTCGRPCERHRVSLRDRAGMDHPVEADVGCRNTVFHARAQSGAELWPALRDVGVRRVRVELVRESPEQVARVVAAYRRMLLGEVPARQVWRDLGANGGYGIVRGSLRVIS
jgi:putative protease